jgi:transcription antitermination factor NusG
MTRHWYAVYTRPLKERKVAALLTKKGIENFCPFVQTNDPKSTVKKEEFQPLFNAYVFVFMHEYEVKSLLNLPGIVSIIYWKAKPAIINTQEIDILKQLTATYSSIKLEKTPVNMDGVANLVGEPLIAFKENSMSLKYQSVKINLPTLGYNMIAERSRPSEVNGYQQSTARSSSLLSFLPKRLNALLF